jgi:hypothetical protein
LLRRLLYGIVLKKRPKKILVKYATNERVERAEVAGQATKEQTADKTDQLSLARDRTFISAVFFDIFIIVLTIIELRKSNAVKQPV